MKELRVALAGPSGVGKTTLAKFIAKEFDIPFEEGSASLTLNEDIRKELEAEFGYSPKGHKNVIALSAQNPAFANAFQKKLLESRIARFENKKSFITDRSPLDNIAYYIAQNSAQSSDVETTQHIARALTFAETFTHIISIGFVNEERQVEDNGSRIVNPYFQEMMSHIFKYVLTNYVLKHKPSPNKYLPYVLEINFWDLDMRKKTVKDFLETYTYPA